MAWKKFSVCIATIAFLIQLQIARPARAEIRFENEREIYDLLLNLIPPGTYRNDALRILGSPEEAPITGYEDMLSWVLYEGRTLEMIVIQFDNDISVASAYMEYRTGETAYENSLERYEFLRNDLYAILGSPAEEVLKNTVVWVMGEIQLYMAKYERPDGIMAVVLLVHNAPQGL